MLAELHKMEPSPEVQARMCVDFGLPEGWVYKDLPRATREAYDAVLNIIGAEEYFLLTKAVYPGSGARPDTHRSQMLVSPQGIENLKEERGRHS